MQFYKTEINYSTRKIELVPIKKAYIMACNGYNLIIFKEGKTWNVTELITGYLIKSGFDTLKEAREFINNNMPERKIVIQYIQDKIQYLKNEGLDLPNLL